MAKKSMVNREIKRLRLISRFSSKRKSMQEQLRDLDTSPEQKQKVQKKLQMLPRDSSPVRIRNRCRITGRPHGFYRKFGLSRNKLRSAAMSGDIPGLVKASW
jgi:small subunit ribosomal protein S14